MLLLVVLVVVIVRCRRDRMRLCRDREGSIDADTSAHTKMEARANEREMMADVVFAIVMVVRKSEQEQRERGQGGAMVILPCLAFDLILFCKAPAAFTLPVKFVFPSIRQRPHVYGQTERRTYWFSLLLITLPNEISLQIASILKNGGLRGRLQSNYS